MEVKATVDEAVGVYREVTGFWSNFSNFGDIEILISDKCKTATGITKEGGSEFGEEFLTSVITDYALTGKVDLNKALTQGVVGGFVAGKTTGSIDAASNLSNSVSDVQQTFTQELNDAGLKSFDGSNNISSLVDSKTNTFVAPEDVTSTLTNAGSGELFVKIRNGQELDELHDTRIISPTNNASLYYKLNEKLWRDTTAALLVSDTASMLTNYLRTGVAASTYLPLSGGTVSGTINRQEGSHDGSSSTFYYNILNYFAKRDNNKANQTAQITFTDRPGTSTFENNVRTSDIYLMTARNLSGGQLGQYLDTTLSVVANQDGGRVGISKLNPAYKLDVNGTLGVTGATTLSNLAGSGTRMITASSTGLLSTQTIPTGTVTSVGGTGTVNGITLTGTVTSSGNLTLGGTLSNVSLTSQVTGTLPILNGGTGATSASAARTNLGATVRGANTFLLPDLGAISFLRYNADNTVSQRAADGMRSDLGGTTIGQSMFTLTNPSAITFPRFNADNTVTALNAADFRTAIGAGTGNGNGTVTGVTGTLPISSSGGTTPNITIANASTTASGVVTTSTQSMAGNKTFTGDLATSGAFSATGFSTLTGGVSVGTMATTSSLTHLIGVNSSNTVGEITLGSGLNLSGGTLNLGGFVLATLDFPNTSAQSSSDITVTYTGAQVGQPVMLGIPDGSALSNSSFSAWVQSAGNVRVRFNNYSGFALNPSSNQFTIFVLNL